MPSHGDDDVALVVPPHSAVNRRDGIVHADGCTDNRMECPVINQPREGFEAVPLRFPGELAYAELLPLDVFARRVVEINDRDYCATIPQHVKRPQEGVAA
jgi:hypothetical protein